MNLYENEYTITDTNNILELILLIYYCRYIPEARMRYIIAVTSFALLVISAYC